MSLSGDKLLTQRPDNLDDLLNIDNPCFEGMVSLIYPAELQLNKANSFICDYSLLRRISYGV